MKQSINWNRPDNIFQRIPIKLNISDKMFGGRLITRIFFTFPFCLSLGQQASQQTIAPTIGPQKSLLNEMRRTIDSYHIAAIGIAKTTTYCSPPNNWNCLSNCFRALLINWNCLLQLFRSGDSNTPLLLQQDMGPTRNGLLLLQQIFRKSI